MGAPANARGAFARSPPRALGNVFSPGAVLARPQFDVRSEELLRVHDELEAWRRDISQPLQLDIFVDATDEPMMRGALGMHAEEPTRVLLERWRLHYDPHDAPATQVALKPIYKRFMVLLRALLACGLASAVRHYTASLGGGHRCCSQPWLRSRCEAIFVPAARHEGEAR
jgi:hypothetical protein